MFGRKPKQKPHSYIVVLPTGTYWADEFGVTTERVAEGTFHRIVGSDNSRFAEAVLVASMIYSQLGVIEAKVPAGANGAAATT
jgi:hypothetical protein